MVVSIVSAGGFWLSKWFSGANLVVGILFCFYKVGIFSFYFSSESDFPLLSWVDLETEDGPVAGGVIIVIVSVGGDDPVGGGWRVVPVLVFSS